MDKVRRELIKQIEDYFRVTEIPKEMKARDYAPMVKAAIIAIITED